MDSGVCNAHTWVGFVSNISGGASLAAWLVAQIPQLIETYNNKSVEGLSGFFVSIWILGDVCSFIGCALTGQMFFQYVVALYFLFNDCILAGQYWYYGYYMKKHSHRHHHHHHRHQHNTDYSSTGDLETGTASRKKSSSSLTGAAVRAAVPATILASQVGTSNALPIGEVMTMTNPLTQVMGDKWLLVGTIFAWTSASLYFFSRIPQLIKNYQRKSTEDISPFLFGCTLFGNITYATSILVSCTFIYDEENRWDFFFNELPYLIGSAGTIVFDIIYFYQLWLYGDSTAFKDDEQTPLLSND